MSYDPEIHHRRSHRLKGYDYSQPGQYAVTICTQNKIHLFGQVVEGQMHLNELGKCICLCWKWLEKHFPFVELDERILMANHLHGIVVIRGGEGGSRTAPTIVKRKPLGRLIGAFKTVSTDCYHQQSRSGNEPLWQRG
jgi:REP element-mobilizing transposase RayT